MTGAATRRNEAAGWFRADRVTIRAAAVVCAVAAGAAFVPAMVFPFVSLFAFDAPGSGSTIGPYLVLVVLWSVPAALAGSVWCAATCSIRPSGRWLAAAIGLLAIPAAIAAVIFDPLHWRHYSAAQECGRVEDGTPHGKWVCHGMPESRPQR